MIECESIKSVNKHILTFKIKKREKLMMKNEESVSDNLNILQKKTGSLYLLCVITGIFTGLVACLYKLALDNISHFRTYLIENFTGITSIFLIWLGFVLIGLFIDYIAKKYPKISGSGIPQVKGILLRCLTYQKWFQEFLAKFYTGLLAIGAGLSLGREGPSVQLGSYIGFGMTKLFKRDTIERRYLVTSGATAGLVGAFGAPMAGVIFAIEELHKVITTKLLICTLLASVASNFVGRRMFGLATSFNLTSLYPTNINPYFQFSLYILLGIIVAIFGKLFTSTLITTQQVVKTSKISRWLKITFIISTSVLLLYFLPEVSGGGHELVEELASENSVILTLVILFIVKLFFTALSYSTGFAGGIFLPMLVLGAILGKIYGIILIRFLGITPDYLSHFMVLGMLGFFVAVVRAPITGAVLILEMTGNINHLFALVTVSVVAYYITECLKLEPIYEILFEKMPKDIPCETGTVEKKTVISVPIATESELDGKRICDTYWDEDVLVVAINKSEKEIIPKGNTVMNAGDIITILLPESKVADLKEKFYKKGLN